MKLIRLIALAGCLALTAAACSGTEDEPDEIIIMAHDSFLLSDGAFDAFTAETGVSVRVLLAGDAGAMVSQAVLTKDNPTADVMFGIDNTLLSRGLDEGLFLAYEAAGLATVPEALQLDGEGRVTPIDYGDVCINYDKAALADAGLAVPSSLRDLTDPRYRGTLVVQNPASSSPGLAFAMSSIAEFGESGDYTWLDFWRQLKDNDVLVVDDWETAYNDEFAGGGGEGTRPLVVSYASSPPAAVFFSDPQPEEAPTGVMLPGCYRQIEFAGILTGTEFPETAGKLIDYLLSPTVQEDVPLNMFVFPANSEAALPQVFVDHAQLADEPNLLEPSLVDDNRERWIMEWTEIFR